MLIGTIGSAEFLRDTEDAFLEWLHVAIARARAFGESDQADSGIERAFARCVMISRPSRLGSSGTGTFPKRPIIQP